MLTGPPLGRFRTKLLAWFAQFRRDLPWRRTKDPYRIWLSEIMLQQTRVAAVIPYYERFLAHFPDVKALANAPEEDVLRLWAGLGYYSRARNLQKAARQIVAQHHSSFPDTASEVLKLSGIGEYTAAAILSIAYNKKLAVLDGNVARVIARLAAIRGDLRANGRWQELQAIANDLLSPRASGDWNEAMMELGATICTPRSPRCLVCPVSEFCEARKLGLTESIPEKRKKREGVDVALAAMVMVDADGQTLLLPPPGNLNSGGNGEKVGALLSRMWHFPTIQIKRTAKTDLRDFAKKDLLGGRPLPSNLLPLPKVRHTVTFRSITIEPFLINFRRIPRIAGAKILPLHDLNSVPISNLTRKVARSALANPAHSPSKTALSPSPLPF